MLESGYHYFEMAVRFTGNGAPPAVGIVDADCKCFDDVVFPGVAITISEVDRSRQSLGSFALHGSTPAVVRSGAFGSRDRSTPGILGSNLSDTARTSFSCLSLYDENSPLDAVGHEQTGVVGVLLDLKSRPCVVHFYDRSKDSLLASVPIQPSKYRCQFPPCLSGHSASC